MVISARSSSSSMGCCLVLALALAATTSPCLAFPTTTTTTTKAALVLTPSMMEDQQHLSSRVPGDRRRPTPRRQCVVWQARRPSPPSKDEDELPPSDWLRPVTEHPHRSILFSLLMTSCGAILGPFLDSYHSAFDVLQYDEPITAVLWGSADYPALTTVWWVPELFGLAGFLIGWLYILLDYNLSTATNNNNNNNYYSPTPSPFKICLGISFFTLQYWFSGILVQAGVDRTSMLHLLSVLAAGGFAVLDGSLAGFLTSAATAMGGPLLEVGLLSLSAHGDIMGEGGGGYHYNDLGETGFFPLWIVPVYFLGGPANGNLARGFWNVLSSCEVAADEDENNNPCPVCKDTRQSPCPNCDGVGTYVAMGGSTVPCTSCSGRGFVMCRECFDRYGDDPYDIAAIREKMSRMPD